MESNTLDRLISWIAPRAGLRRIRARSAMSVLLAYEGARTGRRLGGWTTTANSVNAEIGPDLAKLRQNSRDLIRNNAFAAKAASEWATKIVGTGIGAKAKNGIAAVDTLIDTRWQRWCEQCASDVRLNFGLLQWQIERALFESGEVLIRLWPRREDDGLAVPFQIQVVEPDYLDILKTETTSTGYIIQGVEFDMIGRIQAYWLYGQHPGEVTTTNWRGNLTSKRVPVNDVLHMFEPTRPGQVRGVPFLAPVITKLRDLDEYADAKMVRSKIEACLAMFVEQPEGPDGPTLGNVITDANGKKVEQFESGMIVYGSNGQKPQFFSPTGTGDYAEHKTVELKEIASPLMPYEILTGDLSQTNYSSYRGGLVGFKNRIEAHQWNILIPQALYPIRRRFIDTLAFMGECPAEAYATEWSPPAFDLLDREVEAKADEKMLQLGTMTWDQAVGRQGYDPDQQIADIQKRKPALDAAGVTFTPKPALPGKPPQE